MIATDTEAILKIAMAHELATEEAASKIIGVALGVIIIANGESVEAHKRSLQRLIDDSEPNKREFAIQLVRDALSQLEEEKLTSTKKVLH